MTLLLLRLVNTEKHGAFWTGVNSAERYHDVLDMKQPFHFTILRIDGKAEQQVRTRSRQVIPAKHPKGCLAWRVDKFENIFPKLTRGALVKSNVLVFVTREHMGR